MPRASRLRPPTRATRSAPRVTSPASPAPTVGDDQAVGLREAQVHHVPDITLAAPRFARAFRAPASKQGAELLYRLGGLRKWAGNRSRAATGSTDLD